VAAFGHITWPVLMRAAMLFLRVVADTRAHRSTARSWDDLLADLAAPWRLDTADELDRIFANGRGVP
jgi:hypothetical protein